jgi:hypothetical protein
MRGSIVRRGFKPVLFGAIVLAAAQMAGQAAQAQSRPGYYNAAQSSPNPDDLQLRRDKGSYADKLQADLDQKEALLIVQQKLLDAQNAKLAQLREQLISLTDQPPDENADSGNTDELVKTVPPNIQAARGYSYEMYRENVMLAALEKTKGEIATLKEFLRHIH